MRSFLLRLVAAFLLFALSAAAAERPRLVVVLVVDQLRSDALRPVFDRLLPPGTAKRPGGFRYLVERGAYWPLAEYRMSHCMTGPGHATIATGAYPSRHGISSNAWWATDCVLGCVAPRETDAALGDSPRWLRAPTLSDALDEAQPASRTVTLSFKPRAAVLLGGHTADLAVWLDEEALLWTTSAYYTRRGSAPALDVLNAGLARRRGPVTVDCAPEEGRSRPLPSPLPARAAPNDVARCGTQPTLGPAGYPAIYSPVAADLMVDAAIGLLDDPALALGRDEVPDVLALSFSAHDVVAHVLGPRSPEVLAMTVAEDRALSRLLAALAARVGLQRTVVALTGDHGGPAVPEDLATAGQPAGVLPLDDVQAELARFLDAELPGVRGEQPYFVAKRDLSLWFQPALLSGPHGRDLLARSKRFALERWRESLTAALTVHEVADGRWPEGRLGEQARNSYVPGRSGDLVLYPRPGVFEGKPGDLVSHMTGYAYDCRVPLALVGPGVTPGVRASPAELVDLAPTLAYLLGVVPPASATGRVLHEALDPNTPAWLTPFPLR